MDKGRSAGVTGVVDIAGSPSFGVRIYWWDEDTKVSSINNTGQGDSDLGDSLALIENGNVILRGKVRTDLFPFPGTLKNASGAVTFYLDKAMPNTGKADVKMSATYRFTGVSFKYDEKSETLWDVTLIGQRISALTPSGFANNATNSAATARAAGNKYLYEGRAKTIDSSTVGPIADNSRQTFNVWGLADTDAAEVAAVAAILAAYATPPQTREKVHTSVVERLSSGVVRITVNWAQLNPQDAIEVPSRKVVIDPNSLNDYRVASTLYNLASGAPAYALASGLKLRQLTEASINHYVGVQTVEQARRDTYDDQILPRTNTIIDSASISSTYSNATINGSLTVPAGFVLRDTRTEKLNDGSTLTVGSGGLRTPIEDHTLLGTFAIMDPSSINSRAQITVLGTSPTPTFTQSGFTVRSSKVVQLTSALGATGNQYEGVAELGLRTPAEDATLPGTIVNNDSNALFTTASVTVIGNQSAPTLSIPAYYPANLKTRSSSTMQLTTTQGTNNQYQTRWNLALRSPVDDLTFPRMSSTRSPNSFIDLSPDIYTDTRSCTDLASALYTTYKNSVSASGGFLQKVHVVPHTDNKKIVIFEYINTGVRVRGGGAPATRMVDARMNGTAAQLYVTSNYAYGTSTSGDTRRLITFSRVRMHSAYTRDFVIFRMVTSAVIPDVGPATINNATLPSYGQINGATFLGIAAGKVKYVRAQYDVNITLQSGSAALNIPMAYYFHENSLGVIDNVPSSLFLRRNSLTIPGAAGTAMGWVYASDLGLPDIIQPTTASFAAFLA